MRQKECERLGICRRIKEGGLRFSARANQLGLIYRQVVRVYNPIPRAFSNDLKGNLDF